MFIHINKTSKFLNLIFLQLTGLFMDKSISNCKELKITVLLKEISEKTYHQKFMLIKFLKLYAPIFSNGFIIISNTYVTKRDRSLRRKQYRFRHNIFNFRYIRFISLETAIAKLFKKIQIIKNLDNFYSVSNPKKIQVNYNTIFLVSKVTKTSTSKLSSLEDKFTNIPENLATNNTNMIANKSKNINATSSSKKLSISDAYGLTIAIITYKEYKYFLRCFKAERI